MMLKICVVAVLALIACAAADRSAFEAFKAKYSKSYADAKEEEHRFNAFSDNMKKAAKFQATNPHATFGVNVYSDMSEEEFKTYHNAQKFLKKRASKPLNLAARLPEEVRTGLPSSIDWRQKGAVTAIKNQGQCGSCWSFSTTGSIEGQWFLAGNTLTSLSEQELVSCDDIDDGCDGGFQDDAFEWLFFSGNMGKISTEASYPYVSGSGEVPKCKGPATFGAQISGYQDIARNETVMREQVAAKGPLAISLDATSFQTYTGGVLTNCISKEIDHAVLIVGFDMSASPAYWIVKNSWGTSWGENGYIRIEFGSNQCLISAMPTTATVNGSNPVPPPMPTPAPQVPVPTTQAPAMTPAPQVPTPAPSSAKTFEQKVCQNSACTEGCKINTLPQNVCLKTDSGASAIAKCTADSLELKQYIFSPNCTGFAITSNEPINKCGMDDAGSYVENVCPTGITYKMFTNADKAVKISKLAKELAQKARRQN